MTRSLLDKQLLSLVDIDNCAANPCLHNGMCVNLADGYKCSCIVGQSIGKNCEKGKLLLNSTN